MSSPEQAAPPRPFAKLPPRARKALIAGGIAVLSLYPLYLIGANVLLKTNALRSAVTDGKDISLQYESASSWMPGVVSVRGLELRIQDRNIQTMIAIPNAEVRVKLLPLVFARTFHATSVEAQGLRYYFRHRVARVDEHNAKQVAAFPTIPGFEPIPLYEAGPSPQVSTTRKKLWTAHVENIDATIEEIWIQEYRYRGGGTARGSFRLEPQQRVWVGPATIELTPGTLRVEPRLAATEFSGRIDARMHEFEVQNTKGLAPLHFLEAKANLQAKVANLDVLDLYFTQPKLEGTGRMRTDARFERGVFAAESAAYLDMENFRIAYEDVAVSGATSVTIRAPERGKLTLGIDAAELGVSVGDKSVGTLSKTTARLGLVDSDVVEGVMLETGTIETKANLTEVAPLTAAAGSKTIRDGSARVDLTAEVAVDRVAATYSGDVKGLDVDLGSGVRATTDAVIKGRLKADRKFDVVELEDLRIDASRFSARGPGGAPRGTWLAVQVPKLIVSGPRGCAAFTSDVQGGSASILAAVVDIGPLHSLAGEVLRAAEIRGRARTRILGSAFRLDVDMAKVGDVEVRGIVAKNAGSPNGAFVVDGGAINAGVDLRGGGVSVKPFASLDWFDERRAQIAASGVTCPVEPWK